MIKEIEPIKPKKLKRREKSEIKSRVKNLLMFLPNMVKLLGNLIRDAGVPTAEKALFLAAIVYVISPLDFIPDVFPFIGQVDDLYVVALTLLRLINRTDESIVRKYWSGGGDIVALADTIASLAPKLLPQRVSRVLSAEVQMADAGRALRAVTKKKEPVIVEVPPLPADDKAKKIKVESRSTLPN